MAYKKWFSGLQLSQQQEGFIRMDFLVQVPDIVRLNLWHTPALSSTN